MSSGAQLSRSRGWNRPRASLRATPLAVALLALALVLGGGLRVVGTSAKYAFTHDESISLLAATCHQGEYRDVTYQGRAPVGRWVAAREWQRFTQLEDAGCLPQIGDDLARFDIHPPLYFWLLHGWLLALGGVSFWTAASLNIALALLGTLALFGLARRVLGSPVQASLVALTWAVSPGVVVVFAEARQYELFALVSILFAWQVLRVADRPDRAPSLQLGLLALITAAGALTHYHFALVAVAGAALLAGRLLPRDPVALGRGLLALAAGVGLFVALHPRFLLSFAREQEQTTPFSRAGLVSRVERTVETFAGFVLPPPLASGALAFPVFALLAGATAWTAWRLLRGRGRGQGAWRELGMVLTFVWIATATAGLYLAFLSHGLAMSAKHLAAVWPFCAFVPVLALRGARLPPVAIGAAVALLAVAGATAAYGLNRTDRPPAPGPWLGQADGVIIDDLSRGVLPRVVRPLDPGTRVFAAAQPHLVAQPERWLIGLPPRALLVTELPMTDPRYGASPEGGGRLVALARERARLGAPLGGVWGIGQARPLAPR